MSIAEATPFEQFSKSFASHILFRKNSNGIYILMVIPSLAVLEKSAMVFFLGYVAKATDNLLR